MDKEEEMDKFLERYNLSSLNQEEIENINRSIISTETDLKLLINKSPGPGGFTGDGEQILSFLSALLTLPHHLPPPLHYFLHVFII